MAWSIRVQDWKRVMKPEVGDSVNILGEEYKIEKALGKGKGGYSFLVRNAKERCYTLKCLHNEVVDYYSFSGNKVDLELDAYVFLSSTSIKTPRLLYWDREREIILKEYIPGETALERKEKGEDLSFLFSTLDEYQEEVEKRKVNLDWYPTNFIFNQGRLYYVDYEISPYEEKWNLHNWGLGYRK